MSNLRHAIPSFLLMMVLSPLTAQTGTSSSTLNGTGAWWQRVPVVAMPGTPGLDDLSTVLGWGSTAETDSQSAWLKNQTSGVHSSGRRYVASISTFDAAYDTYLARPDLVAAAVIDIDGKPIIVSWESTPGKPLWWGNTNLPVWRDFLIGEAKSMVDAGVDGVIIDEGEGTAGSLAWGGSFGATDMALFRDYLAKRYTADQLRTQYGITDVTTFDYGGFIRSRGLAATWKSTPYQVPLYTDFHRFQAQAALEFQTFLVNTARDYALKQYGRYLAFSSNTYALAANFQAMTPLLDYFTVEYPFSDFGYAPADSPIPELKLANSLGNRTAWLLPSVTTVADWNGHAVDTLLKIYTAQSYAARGALFAPYGIYGYNSTIGQVWLQRDTSKFRPLYSTISEFTQFLTQRESVSKVALLYSEVSEANRYAQYQNSYRGTAHALLNAHIQYDVVPFGDGNGVAESPGAQALQRYQAAYLPFAACLSDVQVKDLLNWVSQGGSLIVYGQLGNCDLQGQSASFPALAPFWTAGTRSYGNGRVVTAAQDAGAAYRASRTAANLAQIVQLLDGTGDQPVTATASANVNVLIETSMAGAALLVHLINSDYDSASDTTRPAGAVSLSLPLPVSLQSAATLQAYRISTDGAAPELLAVTRTANSITFADASLQIYDLVVVTTDTVARNFSAGVIAAFTDSLAAAIAAGRDVTSVLSSRDKLNAAVSAGNYLLAGQLAGAGTAALKQATRSRVLFSEAHNERNTMLPSRAAQIQPDHPDWVLVSLMVSALADEFVFERGEAPITSALLANYDVLLLSASRSAFQQSEIDAIRAYVQRGGGLFVLGDCGLSGIQTAITAVYGISYNGPCVFENSAPPTGNVFAADVIGNDAVRGVLSFGMNYGTYLTVSSPAVTLVRTAPTTFADVNNNQLKDSNEPAGPFAVVAAASAGTGRVVTASDNAIHDNGFEYWGNAPLMRATMRWLTRSAAASTLLDTIPPRVAITSPTSAAYSTAAPDLVLSGTASDESGIASVSWSNDRGGTGMATGTSSWKAGPIPLAAGQNVITVTAADTAGNLMSASLIVNGAYTDPQPTIQAIVNAASYQVEPMSAGAWFTIYGVNLGGSGQWTNLDQFTAGGAGVSVCGAPAAVSYNSGPATANGSLVWQLNALIPDSAAGHTACPVVVTVGGKASQPVPVAVTYGILQLFGFTYAAVRLPVITHADYSVVGPASAGLMPAKAGETVIAWGTGDCSTPAITVGGKPSITSFSGRVAPGLCQINFAVPQGLAGENQLRLSTSPGVYSLWIAP